MVLETNWKDATLSIDSIGYNLSLNPQLPWQGNVQPFCLNEPQAGQPCDDENPETQNDIIQPDCICRGSETSGVDQLENVEFLIYPNPTTGLINLPSSNFKNIQLYNYIGQQIPIKNKIEDTTLNLESFENGIYFLKFQLDDSFFLKKIIKK